MSEPRGWHSRGYLPHFDDGCSLQAITYRLGDALPFEVLAKMEEQALDDEKRRIALEQYLDGGHGCCALRIAECAEAVIENWRHFDGTKYRLHAWVVMPNHVHVIIEPLSGRGIGEIIHSWKSYTSKIILRHSREHWFPSREVWQADYFDRFMRNESHYAAAINYIHQNPVKAGLVQKSLDWAWSSAREWAQAPIADIF